MYSIRRKGEIFQVWFNGDHQVADNLPCFQAGKDAIAEDEWEQDMIQQGEMEAERALLYHLENRGYDDARQQEEVEAARGVREMSDHDACDSLGLYSPDNEGCSWL